MLGSCWVFGFLYLGYYILVWRNSFLIYIGVLSRLNTELVLDFDILGFDISQVSIEPPNWPRWFADIMLVTLASATEISDSISIWAHSTTTMNSTRQITKARVNAALQMVSDSAIHSAGIWAHRLFQILILVGKVWILVFVGSSVVAKSS